MGDWVEPGALAPNFELPADDGSRVALGQLRGKSVVLYFYPRDDTTGCSKEAHAFRDRKAEIHKRGAVVLGVSPDDVASHQRFRDKHGLNFPLLADVEHSVATAYGAWREKTRDGETSMGIQRSTFLIDPEGVVRRVWKDVQVDGHGEEVMAALGSM